MPEEPFVPGVDPGLKAWLKMRQEVRDARVKGSNTYTITSDISYKYHYHWIDLLFAFEEDDFKILSISNKLHRHSWNKVNSQNICSNDEYELLLSNKSIDNREKLYYYAIYHRSLVLLKKLIEKEGYDINYKFTSLQRTLLQLAVQLGDRNKVTYLINQGASPTLTDSLQRSALHLSVHPDSCFHTLDIPKQLIESAPSLIHAVDVHGRTPLHYACLVGNRAVIRLLLETGAIMTIQDENGKLPTDYTRDREILQIFAEFSLYHGKKQQFTKVQARFVARTFINDVLQTIQPKCAVCKRTLANCKALKTSNYRFWMHAHNRFKKEMYKPKSSSETIQ